MGDATPSDSTWGGSSGSQGAKREWADDKSWEPEKKWQKTGDTWSSEDSSWKADSWNNSSKGGQGKGDGKDKGTQTEWKCPSCNWINKPHKVRGGVNSVC